MLLLDEIPFLLFLLPVCRMVWVVNFWQNCYSVFALCSHLTKSDPYWLNQHWLQKHMSTHVNTCQHMSICSTVLTRRSFRFTKNPALPDSWKQALPYERVTLHKKNQNQSRVSCMQIATLELASRLDVGQRIEAPYNSTFPRPPENYCSHSAV